SEHATGHLLYVRFWTKFLKDRGWITFDEPAKKLVNQGMIQGVSAKAYRLLYGSISWGDHVTDETDDPSHLSGPYMFISSDLRADWLKDEENAEVKQLIEQGLKKHTENLTQLYGEFPFKLFCDGPAQLKTARKLVDISVLKEDGVSVDIEALQQKDAEFRSGTFITRDGAFRVDREVEKMSKSKFNVVNPDDIIAKYGADTLRLYEMFLGPIEQSKPWDTNGIEGTFRFLRKFWNLFHGAGDVFVVSDAPPTKPELKILHATLKKVTEDIEKMSFNTSVAQFMIAANELGSLKCNKRAVLEPLVIALAPFAPHIAEELWEQLGHSTSITTAPWPQWSAEHLVEDSFSYPISFNGKTRLQLEFPIALDAKSVEEQVLANPEVQARLEGKAPKKVIVVPKRIVNIVV
ncbi:MAG TPA: class I tRNA ligase family protein, partial [Flavobacteriales bacterium]|nr:class I tRNA ligase family protein [Flavobacteriales bacterium]